MQARYAGARIKPATINRAIAEKKLLYVAISTHGDGDPPDEARGRRIPALLHPVAQLVLRLALGDTSYPVP